jgi:hypothetical protein
VIVVKRINTHSTLVSARHGLVDNGKYTKTFVLTKPAQYAYELHVKAPYGQACNGTCQMATPTVLQFQNGNPVNVTVSLVGGFGTYRDQVLALTPSLSGQQKIELVATVPHGIGPINFVDAFNVRVI